MADELTIAVLGGGSFGTVLANMVASKGHDAILWLRNDERAEEINTEHCNSQYLPGYSLSERVRAQTDLQAAVARADIVFVAVPSGSCREVANAMAPFLRADTILVSTTKGIEHQRFKLMSQVLREEIPANPLGVLSGPNLAKEIAARQITATVVASDNDAVIKTIQTTLHCDYFRVYASHDMYGVELGGALKNIYAIMAGMAAAMELGDNTRSMLITRSLAEMSRFAVKLGANPLTFLGLAGVGDLIVTCMSPLSRNYQVGYAIGRGKPLQEAADDIGQVAEGVNTLRLVKQKADEMNVYMPLVAGLYEILFERRTVAEVVSRLMWAEQNIDVEFMLPATAMAAQ